MAFVIVREFLRISLDDTEPYHEKASFSRNCRISMQLHAFQWFSLSLLSGYSYVLELSCYMSLGKASKTYYALLSAGQEIVPT